MPGPIRNPTEAFQQLEAIMLRQMLQSSGAFRASDSPGAQLRTDLFVETLADAVAKAGGLGIAHMLERQMGGNPSGAKPESTPGSLSGSLALARPSAGRTPSVAPVGAFDSGPDSLDDPNSEAPLPEDPAAPSIDDYQVISKEQATAPHVHPSKATHDHPLQPTSGVLSIPVTRALNRYRERVEATGAGPPSGAGSWEKP